MHPYEVMAEPVRRRLVDALASGAHYAGDLEGIIVHEFGVGRSAVQHHLRLLREHGLVTVHDDWPYRSYQLEATLIERLLHDAQALDGKWQGRIGFRETTDPVEGWMPSRRGYRGHGSDPDDQWRRR